MSIAFIVVAAFIVVCFVVSLARLRRGGPGPAMNWIPKGMRPAANREYEKQGWQAPFADDGSRNPDRTQL